MKRMLFINLLALLCAVTVFGGSAVFAAANVDTVESKESLFDDNFVQPLEPGIAEILGEALKDAASEETASSEETSSAEETSSQPEDVSSAPVSSREDPPVSSAPASSAPASSAETSSAPLPPASSEAASEEAVSSEQASSQEEEVPSEEEPPPEETSSDEDFPDDDPDIDEFFDDDPADFVDDALLDQVAGAVQREIIGINTPPNAAYAEAYKAQAVAAHTYMEYQRQRTGSYPAMSYAKPMPQTVELVREVLDRLVYYNGSLINASYHAASGGHTQSAYYVWGNDVPYLKGVESAYDAYDSTYRVLVSDMEDRLAGAGIWVDGDPSEWFDLEGATYTDGDFIDTIFICGTPVTGRVLRENILGAANLKSPKILAIDCDGDAFTFETQGFGHGVGLSQQGALGYAAQEGWDYERILTHYYPGTDVF